MLKRVKKMDKSNLEKGRNMLQEISNIIHL